jgi:hypothetical protein
MSNPKAPYEPQPRRLTERLRAGAARLYPATQPQLELVRQIVRQRWAQQQHTQSPSPADPAAPDQPAPVQTPLKTAQAPDKSKAQTQKIRQVRGHTR